MPIRTWITLYVLAYQCVSSDYLTYHVNHILIHKDAYTQQEGEEQLVLLKERAAHIAVEAECEVFIDVINPLTEIIYSRNSEREDTVKPIIIVH